MAFLMEMPIAFPKLEPWGYLAVDLMRRAHFFICQRTSTRRQRSDLFGSSESSYHLLLIEASNPVKCLVQGQQTNLPACSPHYPGIERQAGIPTF